MWTLPWTPVASAADRGQALTLVGVQLRLRSGTDPRAVTARAERLRPELDRSPDLVGYAMQLIDGGFWVVSAWTHRASLAAFERGSLHRSAQRELRPLLHPPVVNVWSVAATELPPVWEEVRRRLWAAEERLRARLAD
jgi:hypothetical protein